MNQYQIRKSLLWTMIVSTGITAATALAQERESVPVGPAPILLTVREIPKPGEEANHARLEAEYSAVLDAGKGNQYYLGMGAITGTPEAVFLSGYSSLGEMADVHDYDETALGEKLGSLDVAHSGTLSGVDTAIWRLRTDLSNPGTVNLGRMRFIELIHIHVKLGHSNEFANLTKQIKEGWLETDPDFHYSIYRQLFGNANDDAYLVVIAMKSLVDLDKHHSMVAQFQKSLGEDVSRRMQEVQSAVYNSTESNLFVFTPGMSRLPESWTKDDLDFWKPKPPVTLPAKKPVTAK